MNMLMLVFRSSLKERVHALLEQCDVRAYTEVPDTDWRRANGAGGGSFLLSRGQQRHHGGNGRRPCRAS